MLRPRNMAQGAEAQVHDGHLCIRLHPRQPWVAAMRIPTALAARAHCWVTISVHAVTEGTAPVTASPTLAQGERHDGLVLRRPGRRLSYPVLLRAGTWFSATHAIDVYP